MAAQSHKGRSFRLRVLTVHLNQIGDLLFSLPALKCIRDYSSDVRLTTMVRANCVPLMQLTELADEIIIRVKGQGAEKRQLRREIRNRGFDKAITFSRSVDCLSLVRATKAPTRAGFYRFGVGLALNAAIPLRVPPSTENNLRLVEKLGFKITKRDYVGLVRPDAQAKASMMEILADSGINSCDRLVVLSPGASERRSVKNWTDEGFAQLAFALQSRYGVKLCVVGKEHHNSLLARADGRILDLIGKTDLRQLAAMLERANLVVGVDSGVIHLAAAVGTSVVGLYGPSDPATTGLQGEGHAIIRSDIDCSPCHKSSCRFNGRCMSEIKIADVIDAASERLEAQA